jgi:hypothetical protein
MKNSKPLPHYRIQPANTHAWTDIYFKAHIEELLAISLRKFLTAPTHYLETAGQETAPAAIANGYRPLLPAQVAARQRIQLQWEAEDNAKRAAQAISRSHTTHP